MTFSLLPAANTITSAISSGVRGSPPLVGILVYICGHLVECGYLRIYSISLALVAVESNKREFLEDHNISAGTAAYITTIN